MEYELTDELGDSVIVDALDIEGARSQARAWVLSGDWRLDEGPETVWVKVRIAKTVIDEDGDECWADVETLRVAAPGA